MSDPDRYIITQASHLPAKFSSTLPALHPLQGPKDFDIWFFKLTAQLEQHALLPLIDSSIPRPSPMAENHSHWRTLSKTIKTHIMTHLSGPMTRSLLCKAQIEGIEYADEIVDVIQALILGDPGDAVHNVVNIERDDYLSVDHFVGMLKTRIKYANKVNGAKTVTPADAVDYLFRELEEEATSYVETKRARLAAIERRRISWWDFNRFCEEISAFCGPERIDREMESGS